MLTVNDLLLQIRKNKSKQNLDDFDKIFVPKCIHVFEQITSIKLSPAVIRRERIASSDSSASIKYIFNYGSFYIKAKEDSPLFFKFSFDVGSQENDLHIPFDSRECTVKVDDDLNFLKCLFSNQIQMSDLYLGINLDNPSFATIQLIRTIDKEGEYKTVIQYVNRFDISSELIDLHADFYECNHTFDKAFLKMMKRLESNPNLFYSVFSEYPAYSDLMTREEKVLEFLTIFHKQYKEDSIILDSRFLLLDMKGI